MEGFRRGARDAAFSLALALIAAVGIAVVALLIEGASLRRHALLLLAPALLAAIIALLAWRHERRQAGIEAAADQADDAADLREELEETEQRLERERQIRSRVEHARKLEREWNRELREQVVRLHRERGVLGDTHDIRALVLRIAVTLLDAEKGMLLQSTGSNGSRRLEVTVAEGFENDPAESRLARRFATEVIERDTTILEDSHAIDDDDATPADAEIDNLAAIPIYVQDEFSGVVVCANRDGGFEDCDDHVLLAIGDQAGAVLENQRLRGGLRGAYLETVQVLADAIQAKDPHLRGHSEEVVGYVSAVADRLGLDPQRREQLVFGSLLHDLGKIGISERILLKPAALSAEERSVIELHPRIGYRLVERVEALQPIAGAILHHHERWDGAGYPEGLAGEQIPLEARVISVADSFSAMTADRPYRRRMPLDEACAELERCAGSQFDPRVVEAFVEEVRKSPPSGGEHPLEAALRDPEVASRREGEETLVGHAPLALTDNLTLLYTHRYFHELVERHARQARDGTDGFAVVLVELTELPQLNRVEGYAAGDEAIRAAARAVQRAAVRCGGTACRYSGRRLALVCPGCDAVEAERIESELAVALSDGARTALGTAAWQPDDSGEDVIARARLALTPAPAAPRL